MEPTCIHVLSIRNRGRASTSSPASTAALFAQGQHTAPNMPPKGKRKAAAAAGDAQAPDTPEKKAKHVPFADRLFGKSPARGADKASKTVIAVVGGDMHITVFTSLPASTDAVRSLMDPHNGASPFVQKNVYGPVRIPGTPDFVHNENNFSTIFYMDPDTRTEVEAGFGESVKSWKDYLNAIIDKFLAKFHEPTAYLERVPLSDVLPCNMFARWFHVKKFGQQDILDNETYGWVQSTADTDADNAAAQKYLADGDEKRAAHKLRMDALEAGSQSSQDTINLA